MSFADASRKYARLILLVFGSLVTGFVFMAPPFFNPKAAELIVASRTEWMVLYTTMVIFYFKTKGIDE